MDDEDEMLAIARRVDRVIMITAWCWVAAFLATLLDAASTWWLLDRGGVETNPIWSTLIDHFGRTGGLALRVVAGYIITSIVAMVVVADRPRATRAAQIGLVAIALITTVAVVNNLALVART